MKPNWFDLTLPTYSRTGNERSVEDLSKPDERTVGYGVAAEDLQSGYYHAEQLLGSAVPEELRWRIQGARNLGAYGWFCYDFHAVSLFWSVSCIEMALRLKFAEIHPGPFQMTQGKKKKKETATVPPSELDEKLRRGWRIVGMPDFNMSFRSLLNWAFMTGILPRDTAIPLQELRHSFNNRLMLRIFPDYAQRHGLLGANPTWGAIQAAWETLGPAGQKELERNNAAVLTEELPHFRNMMAHPSFFNMVSVPRSAIDGYRLLIEIVSRLWPKNPG